MAPLNLYLFGAPRIERDNVPVHVDTRKVIALLAYLAVHSGFQSRDTLAVLLWPEGDNVSARAALRRTLSTLNQAFGGLGLKIERDAIALDPGDALWTDISEFLAYLHTCQTHDHAANEVCRQCQQPLNEAVALYRGDFLQGFSLRDSAEFDLWQFQQTEHFQRLAASVLDRLVRLYTDQANYVSAIQYGQRWLTLDVLHEPAHRSLMRLYTWIGERSQALRQYRECVRILDQELGVAPLEETTELYQTILENKLETPAVSQPTVETRQSLPIEAPAVVSQSALPFVGRESELQALYNRYAALLTQEAGGLIVVEGEAGIGKTRLLEVFTADIHERGTHILKATCYESESGIAYAPFVRAIRGTLSSQHRSRLEQLPAHWLSELARLLPELLTLRPDISPASFLESIGAQSRLFEAITQALCTILSGPTVGIMIVEDLQWADSASLDLLAYLVRRLTDQRLCLILTWRSEEILRAHRLRLLVSEYQRDGSNWSILVLTRLDLAAVDKLVQSFPLPISVSRQQFAERLYRESEGLPFFVAEYLAVLSEVQHFDDTSWLIPTGVQNLLRSRLARLSETGSQVLSTAAVIERSFEIDILREASGRSEEEIVDGLDELLRLGLIRELYSLKNNPVYDFYHDKLRTVVYQEISMARQRLLHRRLARAILDRVGRTGQLESVAGQIGQHLQAAGQEQEAATYFYLAGIYSRRLYANREALLHFNTALALGHPELAVLHQAIGDLHTLLGEYSSAVRSYESAIAHSMPEQVPLIARRLGNIYHRLGDWDLAESYYLSAFNGLGVTSPDVAAILADWSLTCFQRGHITRSATFANQALEIAERLHDTRALAQSHNILGILARNQNEMGHAYSHLEQSLSTAEMLGEPGMYIAILNNLALVYSADGQYEQAHTLLEQAISHCQRQGDRHREAALQNNLADVYHAMKQTEKAMIHLKEAASIFSQIGVEGRTLQPEIWKLTEW